MYVELSENGAPPAPRKILNPPLLVVKKNEEEKLCRVKRG